MDDFLVDRRTFVSTGAAAAASLFLEHSPLEAQNVSDTRTAPQMANIVLSVNGEDHRLQVDTRMTFEST